VTDRITILYSCRECGLKNVAVKVPVRGRNVDISLWFEQIMARDLGHDHSLRSPSCPNRVLAEVKIPSPESSKFIGERDFTLKERLIGLLKTLETELPPPTGHHSLTYEPDPDRLVLGIRIQDGVRQFFLDDNDLERPAIELIAEIKSRLIDLE
jgi:hypothetical protein